MAGVIGWLKMVTFGLVVGVIVGLIMYTKGHMDGRSYERAKQAEQSLEDISRRGENNEAVRQLDDSSLVCDILGGLPDAGCP